MEPLFWRRTANEKGKCSAGMLNRIEEYTRMLAARLNAYGYSVSVTTKKWDMSGFATPKEINRIRGNVDKLQAGYSSVFQWKEIAYNNTLDYNQANALEWDLQMVLEQLERMAAAFLYSGEICAGEG